MRGGGRGQRLRRNLYFGACWDSVLAPPAQPAALVSLVSAPMWARRGHCLAPGIILEGPQTLSPGATVATVATMTFSCGELHTALPCSTPTAPRLPILAGDQGDQSP